MPIEMWMAGASCVTALVAVGGVVATWRKNGREQAVRDQQLADNQTSIIDKLEDPTTGLSALNQRFQNFEINFTDTRGRFDERIEATERDIKELKRKKK